MPGIPQDTPEVFTKNQWDKLISMDPTFGQFRGASPWQGTFENAKVYIADNPLAEIIGAATKDGKGKSQNWRKLQEKCWELYRTFGPVSAAVNSKSDYVTGHGFSVYSPNLDIRAELQDIFYSYRNRLYAAINGWVVRMFAEGELFILLAFDEEGKVTVRVLEPSRIGRGTANDGLTVNPEDVLQTLFYEHYYNSGSSELIPDISLAFNPELIRIAEKESGYSEKKFERSKGAGGKFKALGGFRRFVLHWKNLTGVHEYRRDLSVISTVLEAVHLYWNAIKWQLDHKKAQCAYTNVVGFSDSPQGRIAYGLWKGLTTEEKAKVGLTGNMTPGSTIFLLPGMSFDVKAPQLTKLEGENQDLLNVAGAGMKSPQDLFQGQSSGSTFASLKASRSPLEMEIRNTQYKLKNFLLYEFMRLCFFVRSNIGKFPDTFKKDEVADFREGKPEFKTIDVEPIELIELTFPEISFDEKIEGKANAYLGSKHLGLRAIGVSDERIAEQMGIGDLVRQKALQALEERKYGKLKVVLDEQKKAASEAPPAKPSKEPQPNQP